MDQEIEPHGRHDRLLRWVYGIAALTSAAAGLIAALNGCGST
ncbi:hypothetical protein ACFY36_40970 [Actinoplanes sp. NPDC000266]